MEMRLLLPRGISNFYVILPLGPTTPNRILGLTGVILKQNGQGEAVRWQP